MKNKTPRNHRFNLIDFTLVITILACLIGIAIRYNLADSVLHSSNTATITVLIRDILAENTDQVMEGDTYYYQRSGNRLGVLTSKEIKPAIIHNHRLDGTAHYTENETRANVLCTLEIEGISTEDGFMVGGSEYIGCGSSILVRSLNLETEWIVVDIEVHE